MIYSSLAILALSASAMVSPLSKLVHMHPSTETRISIHISNQANTFQDIQVGAKSYTLLPKHGVNIKAPVGTAVVVASSTGAHHRGDKLVELSMADNNTSIALK